MARPGFIVQALVLGAVMTTSIIVGGIVLKGLGWGFDAVTDKLDDLGIKLIPPKKVTPVAPKSALPPGAMGPPASLSGEPTVTLVP